MTVTDGQLAALRAQLAGDTAEHARLFATLGTNDEPGYGALVTAAFCTAVEHRFTGADHVQVIEFVASARTRTGDAAAKIDPIVAERLISAVVGEGDIDDIDANARFRPQLLLLAALVADEGMDGAGLDAFMAASRKLADQFLR